jgi:glycosyltransferase involved in cell wall biosynthesis
VGVDFVVRSKETVRVVVRILLTTGIFPPDIGGPATYVPLAAAGLARLGHRTRVLTTREGTDGSPSRFPFEVQSVERNSPLVRRTLAFARSTARLAQGADVVFANGMHLESLLGAIAARRPIVLKIVGDPAWERSVRLGWTTQSFEGFQEAGSDARAGVLKAQRRLVARCARHVIVPSRYLARVVEGWGVPEGRISVIYNAVAAPSSSPAAVGVSRALRVVTVGRLVPWKGIDLLIRAVSQVEDVRLTVVGDGPEEPTLRELARRCDVAERVSFAGRIPQDELRMLLRAHDVFALASAYEGLPHVLLEAMGEGLPVVATTAGGIPEVVVPGETGLLIQPTVTSAANALSWLQQDRELVAQIGRRARRHIEDRFTIEAMLRGTEHVLRSTLARPDDRRVLNGKDPSSIMERPAVVGDR